MPDLAGVVTIMELGKLKSMVTLQRSYQDSLVDQHINVAVLNRQALKVSARG